jgi:hypothetical protein
MDFYRDVLQTTQPASPEEAARWQETLRALASEYRMTDEEIRTLIRDEVRKAMTEIAEGIRRYPRGLA